MENCALKCTDIKMYFMQKHKIAWYSDITFIQKFSDFEEMRPLKCKWRHLIVGEFIEEWRKQRIDNKIELKIISVILRLFSERFPLPLH